MVRQAVDAAAERLRLAGIERPRLEARLLLAHAHGVCMATLLSNPGLAADLEALAPLLDRRAGHEPLALILGQREFWSLDLAVSPATLIPRPESETLIEAALGAFAGRAQPRRILDLGTGTGCLLLAALSEFPEAYGVGVDRAPPAALLAARNACALGLAERAAFLCGDWDEALDARFDLVLSNPPYIRTGDLAGLMPEVALFEPRSALDGGADGLGAYRRLIPALPRLLRPDGVAVLEIGAGQEQEVESLAQQAGFTVSLQRDLSGIMRAVVLRPALP